MRFTKKFVRTAKGRDETLILGIPYATECYALTRDAGCEVFTNGQRLSIRSTESASRLTPSLELVSLSSTNLRVSTVCDVLTLSRAKVSVAD